MITEVLLRNFKKFGELRFELPGHVVFAGPNNTGKTTLLQAIATWSLALERWRAANGWSPGQPYPRVPMTRSRFSSVPLRNFELLWNDRDYRGQIEIGLTFHGKGRIVMVLEADSTEQVYVHPHSDVPAQLLVEAGPSIAFIPPMTGLSVEEPVYQKPKIEQLLGMGKPGDVLRNLLLQTSEHEAQWQSLTEAVRRLFHFELLRPDGTGADIIAEYRHLQGVAPKLDIASAGSGFQQALMLLTFLHARPGSHLLVDEPDAHLHVILQDAIYHELRSVAERSGSQLIIATHSEVLIDAVEPDELYVMLNEPRKVAGTEDRRALIRSLRALDNADVMRAMLAPGILYLEGHTDLALLREWARILDHQQALQILGPDLFWRPTVWELREGASGVKARDHYEALKLVRPDLPGLILLDGDDHPGIGATPITGKGLQRLRWRRYEIESYLFHPLTLESYARHVAGEAAVHKLLLYLQQNHLPSFLQEPFSDPAYLQRTKARTELLPPALEAAGIHLPYTRYREIAAHMKPEEVHPEVREKLDGLSSAFGLGAGGGIPG